MTAFSPSDLPPSVTTVEQLAVWSMTLLNHLYPETLAIDEGRTQDLAVVGAVVQNAPSPNSSTPYLYLYSCRALLPLASNWRLYGNEWQGAIALGNAALPAHFTG